ncbi:MAG: bifunctional DNA primase/polymerase [Candidatus Cybelea sp.]
MRGELCKAACEYIDQGFVIYALNENTIPYIKKWNTTNAIRTHDRAQEVFLNDPKGKAHGVGLVCGLSDITPVDVDPKNGGDVTFRRLVFEVGYKVFEDCPQVISPSGGLHCWFRMPPELSRETHAFGAHALGLGIDVIGPNNGIVVPPTTRKDGVYVWRDGTMPDLSSIPVFPEVLLDLMRKEKKKAQAIAGKLVKEFGARLPGQIPAGEANQTLMRIGYRLRGRFNCTEEELRASLRELNKRCTIPLEDAEIQYMARSISNAPAQFVDPSAWLKAWLPELRGQGLRVAAALAMIAEFAPGPLTPSAEQVKQISGMLPNNYRSTRKLLAAQGMLKVHGRGDVAPVIDLLMPGGI